MKVKTLCYIW